MTGRGRRGPPVAGAAAVWLVAALAGIVYVVAGVLGSGFGPERLQLRDLVPWIGLAGLGFAPAVWLAAATRPDAAGGATARRFAGPARIGAAVASVATAIGAVVVLSAAGVALGAPAGPAGPTASPRALAESPSTAPEATTEERCGSIQALVDAAATDSTVVVPACIYRETVTIDRPLTLRAEPGAEIRGSNVWDRWTRTDAGWVSDRPAPTVVERGTCAQGTTRCKVALQVFVDGTPLELSDRERPDSGTFASVDGLLVLGDDPTGRVVEVSVRELWVHVVADGVTIEGFVMRHSIVPAQGGGITAGGFGAAEVDHLTVRDCRLSDAHGAIISLQGGSGHRILANRLERAGQLGLHLSGTDGSQDWRVIGNYIADNNTAEFDVGWEAGGLKALHVVGLEIRDNEFAGGPNGDNGRGAWTDTGTRDVTFIGNRMHDNGFQGALFESTHGLLVADNVAWNNGWRGPEWAWGGGIVLSSSDHAAVRDNVVAWNADGISVVSQARDDDEPHVEIAVEENTILALDQPGDRSAFSLAWVADWPGMLFDDVSGNAGRANRYWYPKPEGASARFAWQASYRLLGDFAATPGDEDPLYLSDREAAELIRALGLPEPPDLTDLDAAWSIVQLGIGLIAFGSVLGWAAAGLVRRRTRLIGPAAVVVAAAALAAGGLDGPAWPIVAFGVTWAIVSGTELWSEARRRPELANAESDLRD